MKILLTAAAAALLAAPVSARDEGKPADKPQPASYWQLNYGYSQTSYSYNIAIETADLDKTEAQINDLAVAAGMNPSPSQPQYQSGRNMMMKSMSFSTTPEKAEAFCQKVITVGKLKQYSAYASANDAVYQETKKKAAMIKDELDGNQKLLEKLPIARALLTDLAAKYKANIAIYESSLTRAAISISLSAKQQE